ncbi:DUF2254 family protein [Streptomyces sp. cmx-4-9]|uniref:DUF2254 family protein n=1 Tax=Streptomyces sp. cmx-4-9 TaxID=2790941 RepID=UPI00397ED217
MAGSAEVTPPLRPGRGRRTAGPAGGAFHRPTRAMRRNLAQAVCAAVGLVLGLLAPHIEGGPQVDAARASTMLFTIGFGIVSLVAIIYSMLFLVVQFSASTFTPRLGLFREDPIVWWTFAFVVGVFLFSVSAGLAAGNKEQVSVAVPMATVLFALVALAAMRTLQTRAFTAIQLAPALASVAERAHRLIGALYARPYAPHAPHAPHVPDTFEPGADQADEAGGLDGASEADEAGGTRTTVVWPGDATVLQQIDVPALTAAAERHGCRIVLAAAPGSFLPRGAPLARIHGPGVPPQAVLKGVRTGPERTFDQDPGLPLRLLADITLRALSPAVNDPATAVQTLDHTEDLLTRLAGRDLAIGTFTGPGGAVRLTVPVPTWEQYVRLAVDDVMVAAAESPMTLLRLRLLLTRLRAACPPARRPVVESRLTWTEAAGSARFPLHWSEPPGS